MADIKQALNLYTMMADRCERDGYAPRQTKVYREIVELMRGCPTAEDAAIKIKNSKYYLAPGAAFIQDKLAAQEKAARENRMVDVAEIYGQIIAEIDKDIQAMYETGYETRVQNLKIQYIQTYEAFINIYDAYLTLSSCSIIDTITIRDGLQEMQSALNKLVKPSSDFNELANLPMFRALIPVNDRGYSRFVKKVASLSEGGADFQGEKKQIQVEYEQVKGELGSYRASIMEAGKINAAKIKRSQVLVLAPQSKFGSYEYIDEVVTDFE